MIGHADPPGAPERILVRNSWTECPVFFFLRLHVRTERSSSGR